MPDAHPDELTFRISPPNGGNEVPIGLLVQSLTVLQELVFLFGFKEENRPFRHRLRIPQEIQTKYVLNCAPPRDGSFEIRARVGSSVPGQLFPEERAERVVKDLMAFTREVAAGQQADALLRVPDTRLRHRIFSRFSDLGPPAGSGHRFELSNGIGSAVELKEEFRRKLQGWITTAEEREEIQTVTGQLLGIEFSERKLTLLYQPKSRSLECIYDEDIEPMLFENRRNLIQVTGRVLMDDNSHPKKIVDVEQIQDIDLSPFVVDTIEDGTLKLAAAKPLTLTPFLSESEQLICVEDDNLDIDVFAPTRSELFDELKEQIAMLWIEFAQASTEDLSLPAQGLQQRLREQWMEVPNA